MAEIPLGSGGGDAASQPPKVFVETMAVPLAKYRTAIAIKTTGPTAEVNVAFSLVERMGDLATYTGRCPRCRDGEIVAQVKLKPDGSFSERPACPGLCVACEERLDAILGPSAAAAGSRKEPVNRSTLAQHLQAMTRRWD